MAPYIQQKTIRLVHNFLFVCFVWVVRIQKAEYYLSKCWELIYIWWKTIRFVDNFFYPFFEGGGVCV